MDTSKFKIVEPVKTGIATAILWTLIAFVCKSIYFITGLEKIFIIDPTYFQWLGIVGIVSFLFYINDIPHNNKIK